MKRMISTFMVAALLVTAASAFADTGNTSAPMPVLISEPVPTLYDNTSSVNFDLVQDNDEFTIILDENITTGYSWIYTIKDKAHVSFISDSQVGAQTDLIGAGGTHAFKFKVNSEGVSTITFDYQRPWENGSVDTLTVLVYKNGDTVIVEEDKTVYALDGAVTTETAVKDVFYKEEKIVSDVDAQIIDGVVMVPLRSTLEKMGYKVTWNQETRRVEIQQGAQWTSVGIGENAYFKNRMAPAPLSAAPVIVNGRTLVPAEFFSVILGKNLMVESGNLSFDDQEAVIHSGYVKEISTDETGMTTITLTSDMDSDDIMLQTIIHTSKAFTFYQKEVIVGDFVSVVSAMFMTMSIPGQTSGYLVF
ncbi:MULTISPECIES: stalk domain-containing protein [unclassified Fusibacter]|uniref:stalk domain-containing protein n=1 Tax=unclassified Fusibacter TaxID=2624464 RepID=UPI00101339BD|nr:MULTISPECIES: protease inhibitor I42 family protein [unclassified Fusibacter]MCK8060727.1 stalk domain-containing protein [Fusibacter sp. A2]NPE23022.1 hypothetical protein [Fusibacter sp. A1]RXV59696.1 hypothetical protein DWB64_14355 [Fusibacter sp. A1]